MNRKTLLALLSCALISQSQAFAENWAQWRGPYFNGSTTETKLPDKWSTTENVLWTAPMHGSSHATPIVWNDVVFVTSPDANKNLLLFCIDRKTGKVRWQKEVATGDRISGRNNMASPSPVTDGKAVWVMFGTGDLAAYDFSGKQLWARNLAKESGKFSILWLYGSSPVLYKDRLYVQVLQQTPVPSGYSHVQDGKPTRDSFILCLDPQTGKDIWKHVRPSDAVGESQEGYSTPMPSEVNGKTELVVVGGDYVTGHDIKDGTELWRGGGLNNPQHRGDSRLVPSPLIAAGLVIVSGPKRMPVLAYRDGGKGDITQSGLAWTYKDYPTDCVTPLFYQKKIFVLDGDKQMMTCLEPDTGKVIWQQPMGIRHVFRASPTGADGKLYCFSEHATAVVMDAKDGKVISKITMEQGGESTHATIAVSQGCLFIRGAKNLYCIGKK
jgi:outer membrane protein assembly factor BamB